MRKEDFEELIRGRILLGDGAIGTMIQASGVGAGELPEALNITHPELIRGIHEKYFAAGSDFVSANTFGASRLKLETRNLTVDEVISAAVANARAAAEAVVGAETATEAVVGAETVTEAVVGAGIAKETVAGAKTATDARAEAAAGAPDANSVNGRRRYVALDVAPLGKLMEPMGDMTFEEAYELFKEQAIAGEKAGVDFVLLETFTDIFEIKAAVLAVLENTSLPTVCSVTFQEDGRMLTGTDPTTAVHILQDMGISAIGTNCSLGPRQMLPIVREIIQHSRIPVIVQPNAGLPRDEDGETVYDVGIDEFIAVMSEIAEEGAAIIGGCCGTTPEYIKGMEDMLNERGRNRGVRRSAGRSVGDGFAVQQPAGSDACANAASPSNDIACECVKLASPSNDLGRAFVKLASPSACSPVRTVEIDGRVRVVGERLNPTGKKRLKQALADKDYDYIEDEAIAQINAGAEILEVNMGLPDIDEREVLLACVKRLEGSVNVPLMIDCTDAKIIEDVVRACRGKPIINSVNGEAGKMREIFPIVKKYGTAVVALTLDENGIPESVEGRLEILDKIIAAAESYGIARERIIVDCLTLTVSAMQDACLDTLAAMRIVKERYGLRMTLGVSNISFGLPERSILTGTFLSMAMLSGLDAPIMDPLNRAYMNVIKSGEVLLGSDRGAEEYIGYIGNLNRNGGGAVAPGGGTSGGGTAFGGASGRGTTPGGGTGGGGTPGGGGTGGGGTPGGGSASGGGSLSDGTNFGGATSGGSGMASGSSGASGSETSSAGSAATAEAKTLNEIIRKGFASRAAEATKKLLEDREPLEVIEDIVLPALEHVGNDFERGEIFLPQMIKSAETAKNSFEILRAAMSISGKKISYGRIILATVKDDIHDIGKNIVKAIMENYGYDVVDLGKDVPPELVVKTARDEGINFVGLSALMTTTVVNMARTIKMLRDESVDCVVAVGGAVLTADYARKIGADYYCRNAMDAVHAANGVFKK